MDERKKSERRRVKSIDVAREAGVSQATVSYVLNNDSRQSISTETRAKVLEAARRLGYQPFAPARSLRVGKSKIVLVVWQESVVEAAVSLMIETLTGAVAEYGYSLVWQLGFHAEQTDLATNLAPAVVVGLIDELDTAAVASLQRFNAPIITFPSHEWFSEGPRMQVEYALKKRPQPIVYATTEKPQLQHLSRLRQEAIQQACLDHGQPAPYVQVVPQSREGAKQALINLLAVQPPPITICAYNDEVALAVLAALADLRLAVPDDVAVIGHDNTMLAELSVPPMTSVGLKNLLIEDLVASVLSVCRGGPVLDIGSFEPRIIVRASA